jgi:hypothetical protein
MKLRPATLADLELLRHWDEQPHSVASDDDCGWETELARFSERRRFGDDHCFVYRMERKGFSSSP